MKALFSSATLIVWGLALVCLGALFILRGESSNNGAREVIPTAIMVGEDEVCAPVEQPARIVAPTIQEATVSNTDQNEDYDLRESFELADQDRRDLIALRAEVAHLRTRNRELEVQLSTKLGGQVGNWRAMVEKSHAESLPSPAMLHTMAYLLHGYPVVLQEWEGWWLLERIKKNDWGIFAPTVDEAIFEYLGEARLLRELTPEQFAACKPD